MSTLSLGASLALFSLARLDRFEQPGAIASPTRASMPRTKFPYTTFTLPILVDLRVQSSFYGVEPVHRGLWGRGKFAFAAKAAYTSIGLGYCKERHTRLDLYHVGTRRGEAELLRGGPACTVPGNTEAIAGPLHLSFFLACSSPPSR